MNNEILVSFTPINFYKGILFVVIKVIGVFCIGAFLFFILSDSNKRSIFIGNVHILLIVFCVFIFLAGLQTFINGRVYIYSVILNGDRIYFEWQDFNRFKNQSCFISDIDVLIKPAGKNSPYLQIVLKNTDEGCIILNQTYYPKWDMEKNGAIR